MYVYVYIYIYVHIYIQLILQLHHLQLLHYIAGLGSVSSLGYPKNKNVCIK